MSTSRRDFSFCRMDKLRLGLLTKQTPQFPRMSTLRLTSLLQFMAQQLHNGVLLSLNNLHKDQRHQLSVVRDGTGLWLRSVTLGSHPNS